MKAPAFWWRPAGLAAHLLAPAAWLYGAVAGGRMDRSGAEAAIPVLCIGNVTVGGAGKTPTALAVAAILREMGWNPAFLSRGYGGTLPGPIAVDPERHASRDVGDEPLLLAACAPTIVSRDRPAGAALAAAGGADIVVMDDGFQNPSLAKDLVLAVFDGAVGIGNGCVLPAGPLRAPMAPQWLRIGGVVVVGPGAAGDLVAEEASRRDIPVHRASLVPDPALADRLAGRRILAFAGIGRPEKFFETCRAMGLAVEATEAFPDHHAYAPADITRLLDRAEAKGLVPLTTEKDWVRLAPLAAAEPRLGLIQRLPVTMAFADEAGLRELLEERLIRRTS